MIGDLDSVWSVGGVDGDGVKALRMGGASGEAVLTAVRRNGQRLRLARKRG